jgi:glycosyltransferase involved in cell wall biosynthesis
VSDRSVGLVHDYLLVMRGAERSFEAIAECFPEAPIYTLLYDERGTGGRFRGRRVQTSYLQRLGIRQRGFRRLLPLFPRAVERLPVADHDLIISSSSAFAHGVRPAVGAVHVCYCYTPFRYAWHERERAIDETPAPLRPVARRVLDRVRAWDIEAARRTTHYIAISELSRCRIREAWGRDATVVPPPVDIDRFEIGEPEDFFLIVTELVRHKRVELAVEAAKRAGRSIKVVGTGPELSQLASRYSGTAEFLGRIDDRELAQLYSRCLAYVMPNIEEFGISAVEAQAAGRPVLAADGGGARETVADGKTGVLVEPGEVDALAQAMRDTDFSGFDPTHLRRNAERFSRAAFKSSFMAEIARVADGTHARDTACR